MGGCSFAMDLTARQSRKSAVASLWRDKSEIRNSKSETNPKSEVGNVPNWGDLGATSSALAPNDANTRADDVAKNIRSEKSA